MRWLTDLPYGRQSIDEEDVAAVVAALRSDFLTTGPESRQFEASPRGFTASRTQSLELRHRRAPRRVRRLGVGPGDEIVTSPLTFAATGTRRSTSAPDPCSSTSSRRPAASTRPVWRRRSPAERELIVAVDYAGQPADYAEIRKVAARHGLPIVADAAHSLGAARDGAPSDSSPT